MKILKFGGKSLANGEGLQKVVLTIAQKYFNNEPIAVVVSARGNATDELVILLKKAQANINFQADFEQFKKYQLEGLKESIFEEEFSVWQILLEGVSLLGDYSEKLKDETLPAAQKYQTKHMLIRLMYFSFYVGINLIDKLLDINKILENLLN